MERTIMSKEIEEQINVLEKIEAKNQKVLEEIAKEVLLEKEIEILVSLNDGEAEATAWGCDLTYDYVKINGDYRT